MSVGRVIDAVLIDVAGGVLEAIVGRAHTRQVPDPAQERDLVQSPGHAILSAASRSRRSRRVLRLICQLRPGSVVLIAVAKYVPTDGRFAAGAAASWFGLFVGVQSARGQSIRWIGGSS
jgi:hypothetical protein